MRPQKRPGVLSARPGKPDYNVVRGAHPLGLDDRRDALLYLPESWGAARPAPLIVSLHGAGGSAQSGLRLLRTVADKHGFALLAPPSRAETWDVILGGVGPDAEFIDDALRTVFRRCIVDRRRIGIGGFSDGASYALTLGIANGDLFTHILAFSPGFMAPPGRQGSPRIFVSHGTRDQVLPIERCSRRLVPQLQRSGYEVIYREFDGPHGIPAAVSEEAVKWFLA